MSAPVTMSTSISEWMPSETPTTAQLLNLAMLRLAREPQAIFLGQSVAFPGWGHSSLDGVPMSQRIELPVAEELQLGLSTGLALQGYLPISIYPRMDFLLRAMDQLVLHLDKISIMSCGEFDPRVIIRTRVGPKEPLNAGPQHTNDFASAFRMMLKNVRVVTLDDRSSIMATYNEAALFHGSTLVVERL